MEDIMRDIVGEERLAKYQQDRAAVCAKYRRGLITEQEFLAKQAELLAEMYLDVRPQQAQGGIVEERA